MSPDNPNFIGLVSAISIVAGAILAYLQIRKANLEIQKLLGIQKQTITKYIFPLRKWWWLIVASTLIAAIFGSMSVLRQPAIYQARTTLMIGTTITNLNPSNDEFVLGQKLAASYADLANREIVQTATKKTLGMNQLPQYFAEALPDTQLIEITVYDTQPERAQIVADELGAQLILLSPINAQSDERERQEFINEQLHELEVQITATEAEIETLQKELANTLSAQQLNEKQNQISSLQSNLITMRNNYGVLLSNTQQGAINTLTIIEAAEVPTNPIRSMKGLTVLLAAVIGFILAAGEAYLLEYLDNTVKSPDDVERLFSAPIIGRIFDQGEGTKDGYRQFDADDLQHPISEAFRVLRTNIEITQADRPLKTILVTSADIGDGKTSVASNLALSIAQRGKKVFLLDADLRKPRIHKLFNLDNDQGLVDVVFARAVYDWRMGIKQVRQMAVLTAGNRPSDPAELLGSEKMDLFLSELEEVADVVIIDVPPLFIPDAMILMAKVDGVLLVVRPGHTRRPLAQGAAEQIKLAGARVIGIVLNRIPLRGADFYAGNTYTYSYYKGNYGEEREGDVLITDLEKLRETLSPYANKVSDFIKRLRSRF